MSLFDKLSERVGGFIDEVLLPEDIRQAHERAKVLMKRGQYDSALSLLDSAESQRPGLERTRHLIALCYFYQGNHEKAVEHFERAIALREEPSSHFYAGLSLEQMQRFHDAQIHFQRALMIADHPPFEYDLYYGLGRIYLEQGRADKAIKELRKALRIWPDQGEAALTLAEALLIREQYDEARDVLDAASAKESDARLYLLRGRIESHFGQSQDAREAFEAALRVDPELLDALIGASRSSLALSDYARANEFLLRALSVSDQSQRHEVFTLLGQINEAVSNNEKALENYQAVLADTPEYLPALLGAGRVMLKHKALDDACICFQKVLDKGDQSFEEEALLYLGRCYLQKGDYVTARRFLEQALPIASTYKWEILFILGLVSQASGDPAEAVVALREALQSTESFEHTSTIEEALAAALRELKPQWKLPATWENPVELLDLLHQLRAYLVSDARLMPHVEQIQRMINAMDAPLSVAIVGEFNAGKSTFVNAVLGEDVVATGVLPTTAHPCIIQYGPRKTARIAYHEGALEEVSFEEARKRMKSQAEAIDHLDYLYPHPELRSVNFWDTPGFNALDERHEKSATWALNHADAVLWMLDANQVLTQTEFERIESLDNSAERLIVLINKIDRLGEGTSRQESTRQLVEYVMEHCEDRIAGCFPISALETLKARKDGEPPGNEPEEFEAFWSFLDTHIFQCSGRIKALEGRRQFELFVQSLEQLQQDCVNNYHRLGQKTDETHQWLRQISEKRSSRRAREETADIADRMDYVLVGIEREMEEALRPRGTWFTRMVLNDEDRKFLLELLRERIESVLDHSRQNVLVEINAIETELTQRFSPVLQELSTAEARVINRRMEGFFDEIRALKLLLSERVYGQLRAMARGQIDAAGDGVLQQLEKDADAQGPQRKATLRTLIPEPMTHLQPALQAWYEEFFLAAIRFCVRIRRDLSLLELEAVHRYDFSALVPAASLN